jgi:hypothetical protein
MLLLVLTAGICAGCYGSSSTPQPSNGHLTLWRVWNTPKGGTCPPGTDPEDCAAYLRDGKIGTIPCQPGDPPCSAAARLQRISDAGKSVACIGTHFDQLPDIHVTGLVDRVEIDVTLTPCMANYPPDRADVLTIDRSAGI